jgi:hypothetical protein
VPARDAGGARSWTIRRANSVVARAILLLIILFLLALISEYVNNGYQL